MNLYIRLILMLIGAFRAKKIGVLDKSVIKLRVLPNDLDNNLHMNNGRYLTIMDLGRMDMVIRNGLFDSMIKKGHLPVLGTANIRYRIELRAFQKYKLESSIVYWDEKWAYMRQAFVINGGPKDGAVAAIAIVKGGFFDKNTKTTVPTQDIMDSLGQHIECPEKPAYIEALRAADEGLRNVALEVQEGYQS